MERYGNQHSNSCSPLSRDRVLVLFSSFLIPFSSFMFVPFFPIIACSKMNIDMLDVGCLLSVISFIQFGGGVVGGVLSHNYGLKFMMVASLMVRTFGFLCLLCSLKFCWLLIPSMILIAIGAAGYLPANKSYILYQVKMENLAKFLSISNSLLTAGMSLGPLVGGLFIKSNPFLLYLIVTVIFSILTLMHITLASVGPAKENTLNDKIKLCSLAPTIKNNSKIFWISVIASQIFFFFQHFAGIYVEKIISIKFFSLLLLLNSATIFLLQPLIARKINDASYYRLMLVLILFCSCGYFLFSLGATIPLIAGTMFITMAECGIFLKSDLEMASALPLAPSVAFGVQRLSVGLGALISGLVGGLLYNLCDQYDKLNTLWCIFSVFSLLMGAIVLLIRPNQ